MAQNLDSNHAAGGDKVWSTAFESSLSFDMCWAYGILSFQNEQCGCPPLRQIKPIDDHSIGTNEALGASTVCSCWCSIIRTYAL